MPNPKHILVIRFSAMGDVAMTVPVLRALTQQYPNLKITVLTRSFFKPFFQDLKNVAVYTADLKGKYKGIYGLYKLAKALKALHFDAVADLHNVLRTKILKFFFFGKKVVQLNKGRADKKKLISGKIFQPLKTTHQRYADVFEALEIPLDLANPSFPKPMVLAKHLTEFMLDKTKKTIGIAPFAAYKSKMYPLDKLKSVIAQLSKNYNIILFGGEKERNTLDTFERQFDTVKSSAGKLTLTEELSLISNLDLMLSMDSGNAHLAAMFGVKVLTIWGVTHPYAGFAPFNQPNDYALVADRNQYPLLPTSVYGNKFPEGYEAAAGSISTESIIVKVKETCQVFKT